jgi:serine/threonine protein kinase
MPVNLSPGSVFEESYTIVELVGQGGFGSVYKATETALNRTVAIKVLHVGMLEDPILKRFKREGKVLASLTHPHMLKLYRFGIANGAPFLVMEFVDGTPVRHLIGSRDLTVLRALNIAMQTCEAMQVAHEAGVIHRDLSPTNLMLVDASGSDFVKIIDFGLCKVHDFESTASQVHTGTGMAVGSPHYMSPEQCAGSAVDARSDIYSLGCILYEMIAGVPPFQAETIHVLMRQHFADAVEPLGKHVDPGTLPQGLDAAIQRALKKLPSERYASMREFADDLKLVASGEGNKIAGAVIDSARGRNGNRFLMQTTIFVSILLAASVILVRSLIPSRNDGELGLSSPGSSSGDLARSKSHSFKLALETFQTNLRLAREHSAPRPAMAVRYQKEAHDALMSYLRALLAKENENEALLCLEKLQQLHSVFQEKSSFRVQEQNRFVADLEGILAAIDDKPQLKRLTNASRINLINVLIASKKYHQALVQLEQAVAQSEKYFSGLRTFVPLLLKARCLFRLGRQTEAVGTVKQAGTLVSSTVDQDALIETCSYIGEWDLGSQYCQASESALKQFRQPSPVRQKIESDFARGLGGAPVGVSGNSSGPGLLGRYVECLVNAKRYKDAFQLILGKFPQLSPEDRFKYWKLMVDYNCRGRLRQLSCLTELLDKEFKSRSPTQLQARGLITVVSGQAMFCDIRCDRDEFLRCLTLYDLVQRKCSDRSSEWIESAAKIASVAIKFEEYTHAKSILHELIQDARKSKGSRELLQKLYLSLIGCLAQSESNPSEGLLVLEDLLGNQKSSFNEYVCAVYGSRFNIALGRLDEARRCVETVSELSRTCKKPAWSGLRLAQLGAIETLRKDFAAASEDFAKASEIADRCDKSASLRISLALYKAQLFQAMGKQAKAIESWKAYGRLAADAGLRYATRKAARELEKSGHKKDADKVWQLLAAKQMQDYRVWAMKNKVDEYSESRSVVARDGKKVK